ncbi:hypothetical protein GNAINCEL_00044 [Serratia phage KKP 3709]|nr:hypothetical protein GNAINCEL_00044 [Serratia phage KKP 3709]
MRQLFKPLTIGAWAQSARDPSDTTRRTGGYILDLNGPRYWTIKSSMTWNMGDIIIEGGMSTLDCRQFPVGTDINNQTCRNKRNVWRRISPNALLVA